MPPLLLPKSPFAATLYTPPPPAPTRTSITHISVREGAYTPRASAPTNAPFPPSSFTPANRPHPKKAHTPSAAEEVVVDPSMAEDATAGTTTTTTTTPEIASTSSSDQPKTEKRKRNNEAEKGEKKKEHIIHQSTFRKPTWSYFHLRLITPGTATIPPNPPTSTTTSAPSSISAPSPPHTRTDSTPAPAPADSTTHQTASIDTLTTSTLLTHPLTAYLGQTGATIPIDILKTAQRDVWVRVPRQDGRAFRAGLSGWVGSCDGEGIPGAGASGEGGKVKVAWRVLGEGGVLGVLGGGGEEDMFG